MKYKSTLLFLAISLSFTGCASISGLQTYDLPSQGTYKTEQGATVSVVQLNQENITEFNNSTLDTTSDISNLFKMRHSVYRLNPYDVLSIQLWAYPEITPTSQDKGAISTGYPIDIDGNIQLPLIGQVHLAGKTLPEATRYLRSQFAKYLKTPDVIVRVVSYEGQRYFVNGQVTKSGQYTLDDQPVSIYSALSMAGGVNSTTGDNTNIQLIRNGQTYNLNTVKLEKEGYSLHKLLVQPNDTIFVNAKLDQKIYVMGESTKTESIQIRDQGMTLADVLGESQGINPTSASAARIYVMRTDLKSKTSTIYHLNLTDFGNFTLANQFQMQKNDIVYVDATGLTRWQRVIGQIVPFASAIYSFQLLGNN